MENTGRNYTRGDIYWVKNDYDSRGSLMWRGRPAVIVSNEANNLFSSMVEVVFMTSQPKKNLPTHTIIHSAQNTHSTVLCEQITTICKDELGNYIGRCTAEEMKAINKCLAISLELTDVISEEYLKGREIIEEEDDETVCAPAEDATISQQAEELRPSDDWYEAEMSKLKKEKQALEEELARLTEQVIIHRTTEEVYAKLYSDLVGTIMQR